MSRPRAVNIKSFHLYDKLHTTKTKMLSGVEMTTLYPIKETAQFFMSIEVWAYCASKFKCKKNKQLSVDIPVITNQKTIDFLNKHKSTTFFKRTDKDISTVEAIALLDKVLPNKKKEYFFELDSLLSAYNFGSFVYYDKDGNVETPSKGAIENQKYYTQKYSRFEFVTDEHKRLSDKWTNEKDEKLRDKYLKEYLDFEEDYAFKHNNLIDTFIDIGKHSVCYPVAFTKNTAEWSKEKYGKLIGYAHAGEIFFVVTPDTIFFEIKRHF